MSTPAPCPSHLVLPGAASAAPGSSRARRRRGARRERGATSAARRTAQGLLALFLVLAVQPAAAQFVDSFDGPHLDEAWSYFSGDGEAAMEVVQRDGHLSVHVDATRDEHNVWWALLKRDVSASLDLARLARPENELRIEARIRVSHAPRRVNLHVNTQRTVDFHSHLMEYDVADATGWHTISMTTRGFDGRSGDAVNAQLALMDWGRGRFRVDVDYYRVDVVAARETGDDMGVPVPYHPPVPDPATLAQRVAAAEVAVVDTAYEAVSLTGWHVADAVGKHPVVTVDGTRFVLLRFDFGALAGRRAVGAGVLALTTRVLQQAGLGHEEFGRIRVVEITGGDPAWERETVTFEGWRRGRPLDEVANPQMIIDLLPAAEPGGATLVTISWPVLQRLLDGRTLGLLLRPLGPISASFDAPEEPAATRPALHFDVE